MPLPKPGNVLNLSTRLAGASADVTLAFSRLLAPDGLVGRLEATLVALGVVALILLVSPWWADRFGMGPFERLWRSGARLLA